MAGGDRTLGPVSDSMGRSPDSKLGLAIAINQHLPFRFATVSLSSARSHGCCPNREIAVTEVGRSLNVLDSWVRSHLIKMGDIESDLLVLHQGYKTEGVKDLQSLSQLRHLMLLQSLLALV
jgi:hypothetical protein